ncbi:MAG: T9SS type A sorting domain-containing protein [Fibromonadales bacterium]|nr:T9SS type A sorting domain-containing protein [Fibromonadales bacterium]
MKKQLKVRNWIKACAVILIAVCGICAQNVTTLDEFNARVASYATATSDVEIVVGVDLTLTSLVTIPANANGKTLTIRSVNSEEPVVLKRGVSGNLFTVSGDAALVLEDIIIDGDKDGEFADGGGSLVYVDGTFTMKEGAVVRNNDYSDYYMGGSGGGVYVSDGSFTMDGGSISGNSSLYNGGGVYVSSGTFTMDGGEIRGNTAGSSSHRGDGGGVFIFEGIFTMNGGKIGENFASGIGGGVASYRNAIFIMTGGTISGNTAESSGGGVYASGTFIMDGGSISGNSVPNGSNWGGGVSVSSLTMNGGSINGNTGGGVCVRNGSSTFTMNGGEISENIGGVGVIVYSGTFAMSGGSITGNSSGGVYVYVYGGGSVTFGGTAVVTGNTSGSGTSITASNVYLNDNQYIALVSPATGMNVGITKSNNNGVFVQSGATAEHAQYFHDDIAGKAIFFHNGALIAGGSFLHYQIEAFATAQSDVVIELNQDLILDQLISIPAPAAAGITLTIRSANPAAPVILKRGVSGDLFTVPSNTSLIFEEIIIDGDKDGEFANGGGSLVSVYGGGTLTMKEGAVVCNNSSYNNGGGVSVGSGTFIMSGGSISGNSGAGSGVYVGDGTFTMNGGSITGNSAGNHGGGVLVSGGTFTMSGGSITGNSSSYGGGVYVFSGTFTMSGGSITGNSGGVLVSGGSVTFGGTAVVTGNTRGSGTSITASNVYLDGNKYIAIASPATGMNVGITSVDNNGVFVQSGATAEHAQYFHDDAGHRAIVFYDGALSVGGSFLHHQINAFATAQSDVVIELNQDLVLDQLISIPAPSTAGITLTIRSANPSAPVTLKRGVNGNLFTVCAKLILENIIIDGDKDGEFANGGGGSLVYINCGTSTMNGGSITGNSGGGVYVSSGTFTMSGGSITGNSSSYVGGGVYVSVGGTFAMSGGSITGNSSSYVGGVYVSGGTFTMSGGVVAGIGTSTTYVVSDAYNLNGGIIIAWNKTGTDSYVYAKDSNTHLTTLPTEGATAVWAIKDGKSGVSYKNGDNEGFVEIADVEVKEVPTDYVAITVNPQQLVWNSNTTPATHNLRILRTGESFSILGLSKAATIRIVDLKGKTLMSKTVMPNENISIAHLPKGIYLVNLNGETLRMVK